MVNKDEESLSRRHFLKNTGLVAGGVVGGSLLGGLITNQFQTKESTPTKKKKRPYTANITRSTHVL